MTSHAAPGQAAGYLYQCRYALLAAMQRIGNAPQLTVSIETLDDVAFEAETSPVALLQTKHQLYRRAALTDTCVDLWKTLGIWATQIAADPTWLTRQRLILITTAVPQEGTAASCLGLNVRDERQARDRLVAAIANSKSVSNQQHYAAFASLSDEGQIALLRAVDIIGNSPTLHELGGALLHEIRLVAPAAQRQAALQRLEGWWYARVANALSDNNKRAVALAELESCLDDIREAFKAENLPVDFASASPPEATATEYERRNFVQQLRLVEARSNRISRAKRDYYRAFEQRSKWTREHLIRPSELYDYERELVEMWEPRFEKATESATSQPGGAVAAGQALLYWAETEAQKPIRNVSDRYMTVGSFHMLADDRRVGWHPDYVSLGAENAVDAQPAKKKEQEPT